MQYRVKMSGLKAEEGKGDSFVEEDEFFTIVRFSEENPTGKATALLNWKLLVVELLPEEDAVFVLLLCLSILRSISEMKKEDVVGGQLHFILLRILHPFLHLISSLGTGTQSYLCHRK